MKTILILLSLVVASFSADVQAAVNPSTSSLSALQKQIFNVFRRTDVSFPAIPEQDVKIGFLLNAKNEVIVTDVDGDSSEACEYVKQVLSYQKVKFNQTRQLTRYNITVHLINNVE
ncbi:MAG: hypothetical protein M3R25_01020 [Bacteroidota bacterium]|nr:hypothetical protein [Bacteroidota bacterium]